MFIARGEIIPPPLNVHSKRGNPPLNVHSKRGNSLPLNVHSKRGNSPPPRMFIARGEHFHIKKEGKLSKI